MPVGTFFQKLQFSKSLLDVTRRSRKKAYLQTLASPIENSKAGGPFLAKIVQSGFLDDGPAHPAHTDQTGTLVPGKKDIFFPIFSWDYSARGQISCQLLTLKEGVTRLLKISSKFCRIVRMNVEA